MPDDDQDQDQGPSLKPPTLFGRKKRRPAEPAVEPAAAPAPNPAPTPVATRTPATEPPVFVSAATPVASRPDEPTPATAPTPKSKVKPRPKSKPKSKVKERTARRLPLPSGRAAAAVTGLLVGGLLVGLTFLAFQGCEAVVGTSACGTGPGLSILLAILVLGVVAGRLLLRLFKVPDPGSTSFLGVGLTGVVALLVLIDVLDTWPMAIVIPVVTSLTYLLSWWVTTSFVEPARD